MWFLKGISYLIPKEYNRLKVYSPPNDMAYQKRILGMFAYYSQWIRYFSAKTKLLVQNTSFPLSNKALSAFYYLKNNITLSVICEVDETASFQIETNASEFVLATTFKRKRPIFFSRTLCKTEQIHCAVEKKAAAINEVLRKSKHYLTNCSLHCNIIVYPLINQILLRPIGGRHTQPISSCNFSFIDQQNINLNAKYTDISLLVLQCTRVRSVKNTKHILCWLA